MQQTAPIRTRIASLGMYVPPKVVTNDDLAKIMDTSDEWIQKRSGIKERRWIEPGETSSGMGVKASKMALERAGLVADDVDAIIYTCLVSDYPFPGGGVQMQHMLGFTRTVPAMDVRNQCSGFLYPLQVADAWIRCGFYKRVLIVASEIHSTSLRLTDAGRDVSVLFGDGAGACILEATQEPGVGILDTVLHSEGQYAEPLSLQRPSPNDHPRIPTEGFDVNDPAYYPIMDGPLVFKNAVQRMIESLHEVCAKTGVQVADIDFVIAHQANRRIIDMVLSQMGVALDKTHYTLDRYGNTTAATIPLTLEEAMREGKVKRGDLVAMVAFGSGFTWGASLVRL